MKIWIDGYEANVPQRLGSSQVAFELLKGLSEIDRKNEYTVFLPSLPLQDLPKERESWKYKILRPKRLWTKIALPLALFGARVKPDIMFSPTHYIPRFCPSKVKRVVTIFDLSFLHFPESFLKKDLWQLKNWTKFSVENAEHIITISQFSKDDICSQYNLSKEKITVAYPGFDKESYKLPAIGPLRRVEGEASEARQWRQVTSGKFEEIKKKYELGENYLIYIGTIQPRKNLIRLIEAFAKVINGQHLGGVSPTTSQNHLRGGLSSQLELVVVGKTSGEGRQGWMYEDILQTPKRLGIPDRVKFLGFVPTEDLPSLLSGAICYIQPSLWEGFGIPALEAMAVGTPVIVSNVSSLPEVVGKAGILVDPYSIEQIEQAIRTIVADKKLRLKYSKEGIERSKQFSWDKMARTILKVFENVCL